MADIFLTQPLSPALLFWFFFFCFLNKVLFIPIILITMYDINYILVCLFFYIYVYVSVRHICTGVPGEQKRVLEPLWCSM